MQHVAVWLCTATTAQRRSANMQLLYYNIRVLFTGANGQPAHKENLLTVSLNP
jgi:hypothetical protein